MEFGQIHHIKIREKWPHEAIDFTPWLSENIHLLGDVLGLDLELKEREASIGDFSCDIHAVDLASNRQVVIENQLEQTDHSHLGQLLTYAAGLEAGVVVWIAKEIRDEHRAALEWLNRKTPPGLDFFAIVPEVFKIDDSRPCCILKIIVFPNEWRRDIVSSEEQDPNSRASRYKSFFQVIISDARSQGYKGARNALPKNWIRFSSLSAQVGLYVAFNRSNKVKVEFYFESKNKEINKQRFDKLKEKQSEIDALTNNELIWERLDQNIGSRIAFYLDGSIEMNPADLELLSTTILIKLNLMRDKVYRYVKDVIDVT